MSRIGLSWKSLEVILFETPLSKTHLRVGWLCIAAIYLVGIAHWIWFFNRGDLNLVGYDWVLQGAFLNTLRDSQINGLIPWRWNEPFYHTADFLANAEVVLTPDVIALRWLSNSSFIILHIIVLYSCGFVGSMLIVRKYDSTLTTFVFFWLLFNFNGYLTSHLSVGHFAWLGYFFLPFFFLIMFRFIQDSHSASSLSVTPALGMAFLLGALFLNGSVHVAMWCSIFMAITVCWRRTMFLNVLVSITVGGLLAANRLLPAAIFFPPIKQFVLGYATFSDLLDAFTSLRNHDFIPFGTSYTHGEGWWEYDIFIGFTAFVVLSSCLVPALKLAKLENQSALFSTAGVFLLLSLGTVYSVVVNSRIPFITIERAPSRFIIMPFVLLLIFSLRTLNESLISISFRRYRFVAVAVLLLTAFELKDHSLLWRANNVEKSFQNRVTPVFAILPNTDPVYTFSVYAGWFISVISFLVVVIVLFWSNRERVGVSVAGAREWIRRF